MREFYQKHRTACLIGIGILFAVIFFFYLRALGEPGIWYRDFFMVQQEDGSFIGRDEWYNTYRLSKTIDESEVSISFSVNDESRAYRVRFGEPNDKMVQTAEIFENDVRVFSGDVHPMGDSWLLIDENGEEDLPFTVVVGGIMPKQEELFPSPSTVYHWAVREECGTRGDFTVLIYIAALLAFLFVDLRFPDFFWNLKHALTVDGGEPSEFYRVMQVVGRIIVVLAIGMIMLSSLKLG